MSELVTAHQALLGWSGKTPDRVFLHQPVNGQLRETTWQQAADNTRRIANALLSLDLVPGDKVAILAKNSAEWLLADMAIAMAGLISGRIVSSSSGSICRKLSSSGTRAMLAYWVRRPPPVGSKWQRAQRWPYWAE